MSSLDKEQAARFREAARLIGADESDDALDRVMAKLDLKAKPKPEGERASIDDSLQARFDTGSDDEPE